MASGYLTIKALFSEIGLWVVDEPPLEDFSAFLPVEWAPQWG